MSEKNVNKNNEITAEDLDQISGGWIGQHAPSDESTQKMLKKFGVSYTHKNVGSDFYEVDGQQFTNPIKLKQYLLEKWGDELSQERQALQKKIDDFNSNA